MMHDAHRSRDDDADDWLLPPWLLHLVGSLALAFLIAWWIRGG